jgi:hypothetical protein
MIKKYRCLKSVNNVPIGGEIMLEESAAAEFLGTYLEPDEPIPEKLIEDEPEPEHIKKSSKRRYK